MSIVSTAGGQDAERSSFSEVHWKSGAPVIMLGAGYFPLTKAAHMKALYALLFVFAAGLAQAQDQADYQAKLEALQANIKKLTSELSEAKSARDDLNVELKRNESDIARLMQEIERINAELAAQKKG